MTLIKKSNSVKKVNVKSQKELLKEQKDFLKKDTKKILKLTDKQILDKLNKIDTIKVESSLKDIKKTNKEHKEQYKYKDFIKDFNSLDKLKLSKAKKSLRTKIRNQRNSILNNIIIFKSKKEIELLKKEINIFNKHYLKYCTLNDYSLISICSNNSSIEIKDLCNLSLNIIKLFK